MDTKTVNPDGFETVSYELDKHVLVLTLNRPDKLNALNVRMADEIMQALDLADTDDAVRAIIFTGAGRAFCAGADLSAGADTFNADSSGGEAGEGIPRDLGGIIALRLFDCKKPLIAAINGAAVGFGATLTLPMDIRMASNTASFGFVFARRGIVPEAASSWFLPKAVGLSRALEWCYRGDVFAAGEALSAGLVRSLHDPGDLLPAALELARTIADNSAPVSVTLVRQMMWRMQGSEHPMQAHQLDSRAMYHRGRQADAVEGIQSFLEKRPAEFTNTPGRDLPAFYPWWDEPNFQ